MIAAFLTWLESLTWREAAMLYLISCVIICVVVVAIDKAIRKLAEWSEQRAIKERNWILRKQRVQLILDAQRERERREANDAQFLRRLNIDIANDDAQRNRERQQFHLPAAFRDFKGITKQ